MHIVSYIKHVNIDSSGNCVVDYVDFLPIFILIFMNNQIYGFID